MIKKLFFSTNKPIHLILHVTNKCNLRCKTCFVKFNKNSEDINLDEVKKISEYLNPILWLDISGGEPFLRDDLPQICASFKTKVITIPTNGFDPLRIYKITKKIRKLISCQLCITVSLDGFEKTNDEIRGKGSFVKAIKTIELLKKIPGIKIKINTVLCNKNYSELIDFMMFIRKYNLDFHSIIFRRGDPTVFDYSCPSLSKLNQLKSEILNIYSSYNYGLKGIISNILKNYHRLLYGTSVKIIRTQKQIPSCLAGQHHLVIYSNGDVAFCEMRQSIGNLRKNGLKEILESSESQNQRKFIKQKKCFCYHNCNLMDNIFLNPFSLFKLLFKL